MNYHKINLILILIIGILTKCYANDAYKINGNKNALMKHWIFQKLYEKTEIIRNENCSLSIKYFLHELGNLTPWALKMFDATAKFPSGILDGNLRLLGHFDECLSVKVMENEKEEKNDLAKFRNPQFNGQYCLITMNFDLEDPISITDDEEKMSLWHKINYILETMMLERRGLENREKSRDSSEHMPVIPIFSLSQWAVCLPSTCYMKDIEEYLKSLLVTFLPDKKSSPLKVNLQIDREACISYTAEETAVTENVKAYYYSFLCIMIFILINIIIGTCYDIFKSTQGIADRSTLEKVVLAFSLPLNASKITSSGRPEKPGTQNTGTPSTTLDCLDGIRVLSAIWLTLSHKVLLLTQEAFFNKGHLKESLASLFWMPLTGNMMSVDSFFLIGGILRSYNYTRELEQGRSNLILSIIQRYLRITPAYLAVMWFYTSMLPNLCNGPEWNWFVKSASKDCRESWYLNLLYINNYAGFPRMCMFQSWYLAADMHMFILAPIFIYPMWKTFTQNKGIMKYIGGLPLLCAIIACGSIQFFITYSKGFPALYSLGSKDEILASYVQHMHMATHTRMGPYLIGLLVGFVLNHYRGKNVNIQKWGIYLGWILCFSLFLYVLYGPYSALQLGTPLKPLPDSIYAAIHRTLWGIALGWLVFACCKGFGGSINAILLAKVLRQLSNLSYCMFLVHVGVLLTNLGTIRTADYKDQYRLVRDFISDIVVTITLSAILFLAVEAPFTAIASIIFKKGPKTQQKPVLDNKEKSKHQ